MKQTKQTRISQTLPAICRLGVCFLVLAAIISVGLYYGRPGYGYSISRNTENNIANATSNNVEVIYTGGMGSGIVVVVDDGVYVWTAAHVITDRNPFLRYTVFGVELIPPSDLPPAPTPKPEMSPDDLVQAIRSWQEQTNAAWERQQERALNWIPTVGTAPITITKWVPGTADRIYFENVSVELVSYNQDLDVALLHVTDPAFCAKKYSLTGAKFDLRPGGNIPVGVGVYHVGNFRGQWNSYTNGVVCHSNRWLDENQESLGFGFIQSTTLVGPGSSGSGLYLESSGKCIGIVVRVGDIPPVSYSVPISAVAVWAKSLGLEFSLPE